MRIFIIQPPWPSVGYGLRSQNRWPRKRGDKANRYPLYMAYTATRLQEIGYIVKYSDCVMEDLTEKASMAKILEFAPDVMIIEPATPTINYDLHYSSLIKSILPTVKTIFTGSHVSRFPKEVLSSGSVDAVVIGEQDESILELVEGWEHKKNLTQVKGIAFLNSEDQPVINEPRPLIQDLDTIPFPDRNLIPHQWYKEGHVVRTPFTFIITSRGCPNNCSFCLWPHIFFQHKARFRSVENVIEEIGWLTKTYGIREIFIDDGTFNVNKERIIEFCSQLYEKSFDLIWSCSCRVDCIDEEILGWMKKSGCKLICYGPESASQETLDRVKKNIDIAMTKKAIELTKRAGIIAHANFMFGFPWETKNDIESTIQFAIDLKPDTAQFSLLFPHPGSEMFELAVKNDWFHKDVVGNWDRFEMSQGPILKCDVPVHELKKYISQAHSRFFLRPSYILANLLKIRNTEDVVRLLKGGYSVIKGKILFQGN